MRTILFKAAIAGAASVSGLGTIASDSVQAVTFDLACSGLFCGDIDSLFEYSEEGIDLDVTGFVNSDPSEARLVNQTVVGLGVFGGNAGSGQVDTGFFNIFETLRLEFDHKVKLLSAEFRLVSDIFGEDSASVSADGTEVFNGPIPSTGGFFAGFPGEITFTPSADGKVFDFTLTDTNDGYRLYSVEVEKVLVPEPAAMLGLGTVVAGLLLQKRSRKEIA